MRILVTGGSGFIGSHTCLLLLEKGHDIIVLDSYVNSNKNSLRRVVDLVKSNLKTKEINIQVIKGDIRDEKVLENLFFECQNSCNPIKAVIHFAGLKSVKESVFNPLLYWDINVNGSINLLRVMDEYQCRTIVFSSTAAIYRLSNKKLLLEDNEIKPNSPYGNTKAVVEQLLNNIFCSSSQKWKIVNLRYFNPIGSHPSGMIGEAPNGIPNNLFPFITQVAAGARDYLKVFGGDWPTKDGTGVRDYIHVMDLAEGHIAALEYLISENPQIINLNLGTGIGTSVLELIDRFELVNQIKIPYEIYSRREGDVASVIADNSLALSCLDWSPKRSIEQMCADGWKWQQLNPQGYI